MRKILGVGLGLRIEGEEERNGKGEDWLGE